MSITSRLLQLEKIIKEPEIWDGRLVTPYTIEDGKLLYRLYHEEQTYRTKERFEDLNARYKGVPLITLEEWADQIEKESNGKKIEWDGDL